MATRCDSRAVLLVTLAMAACLDPASRRQAGNSGVGRSGAAVPACHGVTGYWIFHFGGPAGVKDHVQLVRVTEVADSLWPLRLAVLPTRDWAGNVSQDLNAEQSRGRLVPGDIPQLAGDALIPRGDVEWLLTVANTPGNLRYEVACDVARGVFLPTADSVGVAVLGVHVDTLLIPSVDTAHGRGASADSTPTVLLRVDDAVVTDLDFLEQVRQRGLVAELAIPTKLVDGPATMNWGEVTRWATLGFGMTAHSRWHRNPRSDEEFIAEFAGSLGDMAAHGLPTTVFAQPGVWRDSTSFDAVAKLRNWRGSLVRSLTTAFESYVYNGSRLTSFVDHEAYGLGHITISNGVPRDTVLKAWARATEPRRLTVFMVHSRTVRPLGQLSWFLDTLASARAAGRIRMVSSVQELLLH